MRRPSRLNVAETVPGARPMLRRYEVETVEVPGKGWYGSVWDQATMRTLHLTEYAPTPRTARTLAFAWLAADLKAAA